MKNKRTPIETLTEFLTAWEKSDIDKMIALTQYSSRSSAMQDRYITWCDNLKPVFSDIEIVMEQSIMCDLKVVINGLKWQFRLIKELAEFNASAYGEWLVCPQSMRKLK